MPSSAAICDWVMLPKNRSSRIFFSRGGSRSSSGFSDSRYSTPSRASSTMPSESATAGASSSPESGASSETVEYALADSRPSSTSSSVICGRAAFALRQLADRLGERQLELLQPPRHPDGPALVPEVPLDLADDGGRGVGGELHAALEVEPVDGLDQPDGRDLGEIVKPLAPVAEPARQVLHERQVQLDQGGPDPRALWVVMRQRREPFEQLAGPCPVGRGMIAPGQRRRLLFTHRAHRDLEDLVLAAHPDPAPPRRLTSTIDTRSPGPSLEPPVPARADSTVHANVSLAGILGWAAVTDTVIVTWSAPSSKPHSRSVPGIACASSIAQASSIAMRRSSISSRVKSSRAASPAVAVRSTDRYALSAGILTCT